MEFGDYLRKSSELAKDWVRGAVRERTDDRRVIDVGEGARICVNDVRNRMLEMQAAVSPHVVEWDECRQFGGLKGGTRLRLGRSS